MDAVFNIELLRDKIIGYVIQDKKKFLIENVKSCRRVNKAWLQSVSSVFFKSHKPLFRIFLQPDCFSIGSLSNRQWNAKPDEVLRETMGYHLQQKEHVPPYSIKTFPTFMDNDASYQMFQDCLANCGSSLVQLELPLLADREPVSMNHNIFLLPRLQFFEIEYFPPYRNDNTKNNDTMIDYIQRILDASVNLESLLIYCCSKDKQLPDYLAHLTFPASITQVNFNCVMNDCKLEILAKKWMPNLRTLKFLVNKTPFQDGLIGKLLENVRKTLETLHVDDTRSKTAPSNSNPTSFQLPVMEKLKRIHIETPYLALGGMFSSPMEKFAPALRHMVLIRQTHSMLRKWTENSCFHFVESLTVSLVTGEHRNNDGELDTTRPLNFDLRTMETLKRAFPNLLDLDITISGADPIGLVFIMKEMRNLRRLCIRALASPHVTESYAWDSLLIGVPLESMEKLKRSPELWKEMQARYSELPSIRNLNDLQTLELMGLNGKAFKLYPIFSKACFRFAFLQMPNLSKLTWSRGFCEDVWGHGGRVAREYDLDYQRKFNII